MDGVRKLAPSPGHGGKVGMGAMLAVKYPHPGLPPYSLGKEAQDTLSAPVLKRLAISPVQSPETNNIPGQRSFKLMH